MKIERIVAFAPIAGRVLHLVLHYELYTAYFVGAILLCIMHYEHFGMDHDVQWFLSCTFCKCVGKYDVQSESWFGSSLLVFKYNYWFLVPGKVQKYNEKKCIFKKDIIRFKKMDA